MYSSEFQMPLQHITLRYKIHKCKHRNAGVELSVLQCTAAASRNVPTSFKRYILRVIVFGVMTNSSVFARSTAPVCGLSLDEVAGSNPAVDMDVCFL